MSQEATTMALVKPSPPATPHVLLVSLPLQGHVAPLLILGWRLASHGLPVTFTTVPRAGLMKNFTQEDLLNEAVGARGTLRFEPLTGAGLSAPDDPRYNVVNDLARHLDDTASAALVELIRRQTECPVTYVVANASTPWALRAAREIGVPVAILWTQSCAVLSVYYHYFHSLAEFPAVEAGPDVQVAVPGLPPLAAADLPGLIRMRETLVWRQTLLTDLCSLRDGTPQRLLVNTFDELEHDTIVALRARLPVPIVPVGPLFGPEVGGGHDQDGVMAWLDLQPPQSVVFVSFGSILKPNREELAEIAGGLVSTGRPFLWVVLRNDAPDDVLGNKKGKVVPWCPQRRVLAHAAVGCFVTHCGWNSTIETLAAAVPVVAHPEWADQPTNAKFLTDAYGVGVRLPSPLTSDALRGCVEEVMVGPDAEAMRARGREWRAKTSQALAAGGSADTGVQDFVDAIRSM